MSKIDESLAVAAPVDETTRTEKNFYQAKEYLPPRLYDKNSVRHEYYTWLCGRAQRIKQV